MEAPHLERKLVAILAADIEGFSSHMERDEVGTLAVLSSHRLIIDASIAEFGGRITTTAGDSVLAEFASVISVINCAVQIQDLLATENDQLNEAQRLFLRIGINVGDVMHIVYDCGRQRPRRSRGLGSLDQIVTAARLGNCDEELVFEFQVSSVDRRYAWRGGSDGNHQMPLNEVLSKTGRICRAAACASHHNTRWALFE